MKILVIIAILAFSLTAFGQTPSQPAAVVTPVLIPEPEASELKKLMDEAGKAQAEFSETVKKAQTELEAKIAPLRNKWDTLIVRAGAKSNLGFAELSAMEPRLENGVVVWVKRPEPPKKEK